MEAYLDIAREQGFDAVLTISNEIPAVAGSHPTAVDKRKVKKVALHHLSWTQVLTEAVVQKVHRGVADPDQAWILGELIRYLEHPKSGAMDFEDMGPAWVTVRESVSNGTLRSSDKSASEVASRWDQLIRYLCLRLGRQLGTEVQPLLTKQELTQPALRAQALLQGLVSKGVLEGGLRIPNAVGPVFLTADLRAGRVTCAVDVEAPRDGRPLTRINWLLRQLKSAPDTVRIDAFAQYARGASTSELLRDARANPGLLVGDPKKELRTFRLTLSGPMGAKRGQGRGSFIGSVLDIVDVFYGQVVQTIKPWDRPPRIREVSVIPEPVPDIPPALVSTALSSQDGAAAMPPAASASLPDPGLEAPSAD